MHRDRFTKIVATVGPATSSPERLRTLFEAGADVFRLNFSHGTHEDHKQRVQQLRALEKEYKHPIAILMDLQGPKLRLGTFAKGPMELKKGQALRFDLDKRRRRRPSASRCLHPEIFAAAKPDGLLLIDDGKVRLRDRRARPRTRSTPWSRSAGTIRDRKGVNLPNVVLPLSPLTPKDLNDLDYGLTLGVDWVALSFVQRAERHHRGPQKLVGRPRRDHRQAREAAGDRPSRRDRRAERRHHGRARRPGRRDVARSTCRRSSGASSAARRAGKPVIVATQMLESMVAVADADARRGLRRRHRRLRRRRRRHAVGGIRVGRLSDRGGRPSWTASSRASKATRSIAA